MNENIEWIDPYEETEDLKSFRKYLEWQEDLLGHFLLNDILIKKSDNKERK